MLKLTERVNNCCFRFMHRRNLVYDTCWEDPRLDREALRLGPNDRVLVITSAGCNALDYALESPRHVYAVDVNPHQNALLELKLAAIRELDYGEFFEMFGKGRLAGCRSAYRERLRPELSHVARSFWDRRIGFFEGENRHESFYFRGSSGWFARLINEYIDRVAGVRGPVNALLQAGSVEEQRDIYNQHLKSVLWSRFLRWTLGRDSVLSLVGVPPPQRQQVERDYSGGIVRFIEACVEAVFACLPLRDNYFWHVYLTGEYTPTCCPEYLNEDNFLRLKSGDADRVSVHTSSVADFLEHCEQPISRFVLLDHMDWLSTYQFPELIREWQAIVDRAAHGARLIWRSGGTSCGFVDRAEITVRGQLRRVGDLLSYNQPLAADLHRHDRVHTYGGFWIADLASA